MHTRWWLPLGLALALVVAMRPSVVSQETAMPDDTCRQAELARKQGRAAEALRLFREALAAKPDHVDAHIGYQKLRQSQGEERELVVEYSALLEKHGAPWCCLLLGRLLHDPPREERLYRRGLATAAEDLRLIEALAGCLARQRRWKEAEAVSRGLIGAIESAGGDAFNVHGLLREVYRESGRSEELPALYAPLLEKRGGDYRYLLYAGFAADRAEGLGVVEEFLERAELLAPDDPRVLRGWATLWLRRKQPVRAEPYLRRALAKDPFDDAALRMLGTMQVVFHDDAAGLRLLREAARLEPTSTTILSALGIALAKLRQLDKAERCFREVLRLHALDHAALAALGGIESLRERWAEGITWTKRALAVDDRDPSYWLQLGELYSKLGNADLAQEAIERADELDVRADFEISIGRQSGAVLRDRTALRVEKLSRVARSLVIDGRFDEARERFEAAIRLDGDHFRALRDLARLRWKRGEHEPALALYARLAKLCDRDPGYAPYAPLVAQRTAECLWDLGRREDSIAAYELALRVRTEGTVGAAGAAGLKSIVDALRESTGDAEVFRLEGVKIAECAESTWCVPKSLYAILRHWKVSADVDELGRELVRGRGVDTRDLLRYVEAKDGIAARPFIARPDVLRQLLRQGYPVMLLRYIVDNGQYGGHASVVVGYDDARRVFLLEDSNWFAGVDQIEYDTAGLAHAIVVAPTAKIEAVESLLPDVEYSSILHEIEKFFSVEKPTDDDLKQTIDKARGAVGSRNDRPLGWYYLGMLQDRSGDADAALESFRAAAKLPGADARPLTHIGFYHLQREQWDEGEKALLEALKIEPWFLPAHDGLFRLYLGPKENVDKALEHGERLLAVQHRNGFVLAQKARLLGAKGELDGAIEAARQAIACDGPPIAYWYLGYVLAQKGRIAEAIAALEKLQEIEKSPEVKQRVEQALLELRGKSAPKSDESTEMREGPGRGGLPRPRPPQSASSSPLSR